MLLAFIKGKFSGQERSGKGVTVGGICQLQNQRVISNTLNTSAINMHSPGGAGPAMASPSRGGLRRAEPHLLRDNQEWEFTWQSAQNTAAKRNSVWRDPGIHVVTRAHTQPPAARGRTGLASHLGHIPDASKQNSLVRETSLQHSQRARYKIQSSAK